MRWEPVWPATPVTLSPLRAMRLKQTLVRAGFRSLLQVWFKCGGSSEAPLSAAEAGRLRREELLRGREHWQWQQQQRRRQWEQQQPEL